MSQKLIVSLLLTCVFTLLINSCITETNDVAPPPIAPDETPVLEITREARGNWDIEGKYLYFKLYKRGVAEYEIIDQDLNPSSRKISDIKIRKTVQLSTEELKQMNSIVQSEAFRKLDSRYTPQRFCTDAYIYDSLSLYYDDQSKIVHIGGHCDDLTYPNRTNFPNLPLIISDLFKEINKLRN